MMGFILISAFFIWLLKKLLNRSDDNDEEEVIIDPEDEYSKEIPSYEDIYDEKETLSKGSYGRMIRE